MKIKQALFGSRVRAVTAGAAVLALLGAGTAVAHGKIDSGDIKDNTVKSRDIKDGTIQTRDLTTNNFNRFTRTENVVSGTTPVSSVPAHGGKRVVAVPAGLGTVPLLTVVLDEGTWELDGVAQFWGTGAGTPGYGRVTITGLEDGFGTAYTSDIPNGGANAAQTAFSGTIKITANDTPVVIQGSIGGTDPALAGASVQATQIAYVKQPRS